MKLYLAVLLVCLAGSCHALPQQYMLTPSENMSCGHPQSGADIGPHSDVDIDPQSSEDLVQLLVKTHGSKVEKATGMKVYSIDKPKGGYWRVGALDSCNIEIGPTSAIGDTLLCPSQSPSTCNLGITVVDSQTFRDEIGFHAEYTIEVSGGLPGVFEAKVSATYGLSYTYSKEYSKGQEISYSFPVSPGRTCTPTRVSYRQRCIGTIWEVANDAWTGHCKDLPFDFADKHRWFSYPGDAGEFGWFQYVQYRPGQIPQLWTVHTSHGYRPISCADVDKLVQVRSLRQLRVDNDAKASLEFDTGRSISAVTCIY
ncbi:hypothetical protein BG015_004430 [Linnemannia schmuckeri]|uniref:Uncharacterized protein n=1 Tax=Linnemannia schmuckeri TaxID=64567 RepID=A0A9P5RCW6_9FUNG|nr:hypothetical protein BG015_004430 [Linnemannia schmuckeri]